MEYLEGTELEIVNRGKEPTFHIAKKAVVIDITLRSQALMGKIVEWRVSDEPSLLEDRHITFSLVVAARKTKRGPERNPRRTDWSSYVNELGERMVKFPRKYGDEKEVEYAVDVLQDALTAAYELNCPTRTKGKTPWWNTRLKRLRVNSKRPRNRAKLTGSRVN